MDLKTSQFGTITAVQADAAGVEGYLPYVDPSQVDPDLRNKRMTRSEAKKFFGLDIFTALSGTAWDGTNKTLALTSNTALTFSSTKRNGILRVKQDGTGGRTLSINSISVPIASGANAITAISFFYDDVAGTYVFSYDTNILGNVGGVGGGDTTAPTVSSRATGSTTTIVITFSEIVTSTLAGWSFKKNGSALSASAVSGSGSNALTFTVATMASGDTLLVSYNSGTGDCKDAALNALASFTDQSVTNGIAGGAVLEDLNFTTATSLSQTGTVWTSTDGSGGGTYVATGLANKKLAAANDGYIMFDVPNDGGKDVILGFNTTNANEGYSNYEAAIWMSPGGNTIYRVDGGTVATTGASGTNGDKLRILVTGSVVKAQKSPDGTTWTDVYTYTFTRSADLFINTNADAGKSLNNPKGYNIS